MYCGTSLVIWYFTGEEGKILRAEKQNWHPKRFKGAWPFLEFEMLGLPKPLTYVGQGPSFLGLLFVQ